MGQRYIGKFEDGSGVASGSGACACTIGGTAGAASAEFTAGIVAETADATGVAVAA